MDGAPDSRPSIRKVDPAELAPPVGFAHAMVASGGRTVYLAGQTALDATGVVAGTYGSATTVPQFYVDAKGRIDSVTEVPIVLTGYVPDTRTVSAGVGSP